jgi:hypothetical protein
VGRGREGRAGLGGKVRYKLGATGEVERGADAGMRMRGVCSLGGGGVVGGRLVVYCRLVVMAVVVVNNSTNQPKTSRQHNSTVLGR